MNFLNVSLIYFFYRWYSHYSDSGGPNIDGISKFYIYTDKESFEFNNKRCIAFKEDCSILSKLENNQIPSSVMLLDGFNQKLIRNILPEGILSLYLCDIRQELIIGSIPNTVVGVYLLDGFNQKIEPGILPNGIKSLHLCDIKQGLTIGSIPDALEYVFIEYRFNQKLAPDLFPETIRFQRLQRFLY